MSADMTWHWVASVLNHLWQSTIVASVAWALCRLVLDRHHPRVRFVVWLIALIKFVVPFSWLVDLGGLLRLPSFVTTSRSQQLFEFVSSSPAALAAVPLRFASTGHAPPNPPASALWGAAGLIAWCVGAFS